MNGMQSYQNGDAAYHRNEPDIRRELAQCKELMANQTAYIKTLQEENLRMLKEKEDVRVHVQNCADFSRELCDKEALIAELVDTLKSIASNTCCGDCQEAKRVAIKELEKVNGK